MDQAGSQDYMERFETEVVFAGFQQGIFDNECNKIVPLRAGKLDKTPFGEFVGKTFKCKDLLAINYYGHYKLSTGIMEAVESVKNIFADIRCIKASVIHFNSIKMEHVEKLAGKELVVDFAEFKKELVALRWGEKGDKI